MARRNYLIAEEIQSHKENPYRNELFHKKNLRTKWQKRLGFIIPSVFLLTIVISLLLSPFFRISTIAIVGATTLDPTVVTSAVEQSLMRKVLGVFPRRQTPFYQESKVVADLAQFDLETVSIEIKNHVLTATIKERVSEVIIRVGDRYQLVDLKGEPTREPSAEELSAIMLKIADKAGEMPLTTLQPSAPVITVVGDYTSPTHPFQLTTPTRILEVDAMLRHLGFIPYQYAFETEREGWFVVYSANRPAVYLDSATTISELRHTLSAALEEIESIETLRYIDARFGSAIYFQ